MKLMICRSAEQDAERRELTSDSVISAIAEAKRLVRAIGWGRYTWVMKDYGLARGLVVAQAQRRAKRSAT